MKDKLKKILDDPEYISGVLERLMAAIVLIAIIIAIISLKDSFTEFWHHRTEEGAFLEYIDAVFSIVIGIEFFKLLWKPGKETLLEVLMFVLARHMIIEKTTAWENLLSVVAIGILFFIMKYLLEEKHPKTHPHKTKPKKMEQKPKHDQNQNIPETPQD